MQLELCHVFCHKIYYKPIEKTLSWGNFKKKAIGY
jgi:hypothetical protein